MTKNDNQDQLVSILPAKTSFMRCYYSHANSRCYCSIDCIA